MKILKKSLNNEELIEFIIKTLIVLANKKPGIWNVLVKSRYSKLLLQIMEKSQNKQLANDTI